MARRFSKEDKGKDLANGYHQAPRKPTIKAQAPDNSALQKYSLTLIGRVTNQTTQKLWSLIPFFTEHWKSDTRPVGADLGNGNFNSNSRKKRICLQYWRKGHITTLDGWLLFSDGSQQYPKTFPH